MKKLSVFLFLLTIFTLTPRAIAAVTIAKDGVLGKMTVDTGDGKPIFAVPALGLGPSGLTPISVSGSGGLAPSGSPAGSVANNAAIGTSAATFTAPANAIGFIFEAESSNSANLRWAVGATATSSVGMIAEPGRSEYVPIGANLSVISLSGTQAASVQWILSQ